MVIPDKKWTDFKMNWDTNKGKLKHTSGNENKVSLITLECCE